jgi:hypothetical protein
MKKTLLISLLFFSALFVQAQKPLTNSRVSSIYTYIYRLDDASTMLFLLGKQQDFKTDLLTNEVVKYLTDHPQEPVLAPGNYLKVSAFNNKLLYTLIQQRSARLMLLENGAETRFALLDNYSRQITDAQVFVSKKTVHFDSKTETYHYKRVAADTVIKVVYQGVSNFYRVSLAKYRGYSDYLEKQSFFKRVWEKITRPIKNWFDNGEDNASYTNPGFMVLNKPKYRPGDTVKLKAFILDKKSKLPIKNTRLAIYLHNKVIGYANAYRNGAFEYQFKLVDSLGLTLDREGVISLENFDPNRPDNTRYQDFNNYQYKNNKQGVYLASNFMYEDYELKSITFTERADQREQSPGIPAAIYLKANDENGLNVPDGRVEITLRTQQVSDYNAPHIFVPDTLWKHQLTLDPVGETKLIIPDSIFPKARVSFFADIRFLNSNNESRRTTDYLTWDYHDKKITTKTEQDTLKIKYLVAGKSTPTKARLYQISASNDTLANTQLMLPANIAFNQLAEEYKVKVDGTAEEATVVPPYGNVQAIGFRDADSLFISVVNPNHIKFWYTVLAGNKVIDEGAAINLNYSRPCKYTGTITFIVNYVWGGMPQYTTENIVYADKRLNISVQQPLTVYPGQQSEIEIDVKDAKGKPVANADLTAFGITKKFDNFRMPSVPYLGKIPLRPRGRDRLFNKELVNTGVLKLNWQHWGQSMGLDTITYYQFTHTDNSWQIAEPSPDSITQIAPFVVKDGDIIPIHILYIDEVPVYFSASQGLQRYSFKVKPGPHYLRFRTTDQTIRLDNIYAESGKKLIVSVNADTLINKRATFKAMPDTLITYEADQVNRYLITVLPTFGNHMATLSQDDKVFLINNEPGKMSDRYYSSNPQVLVGPLFGNYVDLDVKESFTRRFLREPGYSYEFQSDLLKQKSLPTKYPFYNKLTFFPGNLDYKQYVLTNKEVDTIWGKFKDQKAQQLSYTNYRYNSNNASLTIKNEGLPGGYYAPIKSIIITQKNDFDITRIYPGYQRDLGNFEPGNYRVFYLLNDGRYFMRDNIVVKAGGTNFYNIGTIYPQKPDSISLKIRDLINSRALTYLDKDTKDDIASAFYNKFTDMNAGPNEMTGRVFDEKEKLSILAVTVSVAGTQTKVQTDRFGFFKIKVPKKGKLTFACIGYEPKTIDILPAQMVTVYLKQTAQALHETVIRGYVKRNRDETTGSSYIVTGSENRPIANAEQMLQGKVAGLNIQNNTSAPGMRGSVNIRGLSTLSGPMYVVDGVKVNGKDFTMPAANMIASRSTLTADAATAIYGADGANGVVIITTKKGIIEQTAKGLRNNFSDYAYWQPRLTTDAAGKAKFKVTYPDDITNWRTFVIGITDNRQTGYTENSIKAFKPLSANFVAPLFAVRGDTFLPIGKVLNYTTDTLVLNRRFSYNNKLITEGNIALQNAHIDTFKLVADGKDSLSFEYSIKRTNGYFDGEKRLIPLFEQGNLETKGSFDVLEKDTTVSLQFSPNLKDATVRAEASALPALLDETEHLRNYEYLCNEQLASKLKGLLAEKQIRTYLSQPFKWDKDINEIIKKLTDSRTAQGTWGWWKDTPEELWISSHVIEALLTAEKAGFKITLNKQQVIDNLIYRINTLNSSDMLTNIALLKALNSRADLTAFVQAYEKSLFTDSVKINQLAKARPRYYFLSDMEKYRLMYTRQLVGMPIKTDSLLKNMKHTMFGNVYWGEKSYNLFTNAIQQSLLAYRILKKEGGHDKLLTKLRNYFLEQRNDGHWRNTYESAAILETILPDMLINGSEPRPATLKISGDKNETIATFPYTTTLGAGAKITVSKTGDMPVYLTAYQKFWNPEPKKVSGDFTVDTWFNKGEAQVTKAKGGQAINLTAEVTVKADADFVMIEIPIPAGCSYDSKGQGYYYGGEVHREYYKNKVSIFCRKLTVGKYKYTIKLMPRYSGNYHVNPAKAEMMYFPVFYGREGMKMFEIGD